LSRRCSIAAMAEVAGTFVGREDGRGFAVEVPEGFEGADGGQNRRAPAVVTVLNELYNENFLSFSHGFRWHSHWA
jgi:hypothetical protein